MSGRLFTTARLGPLTLRNRLVRSATCEAMAEPDGNTFVHPLGKASPGMAGLHSDELIDGHRRLTDAVHQEQGCIAAQLNHAGRQTSPARIGRHTPLAPSSLVRPGSRFLPRAMTGEEVEEAIESFGEAARRAVEGGYDAVQIHSAHGYLVSEFNSPYANHRKDRWGGSAENRRRFVLAVYRRVREAVGADVPVFVKLNSEDFVEDGISPEESADIARALEAEGIDAIEVSAGFAESGDLIMRKDILTPEQEAYLLPQARNIRAAVDLPVMMVGGLRSREVMERMLEEEQMDFISLSRPFIRQPDLPRKLRSGELERVTCTSCGRCTRDPEGWLACYLDLQHEG